MAEESVPFPAGFLWGTATSAHQVEGGNTNNDWYLWEQIPGHIANGDRSGAAADHYTRFAQDLDLARSLGHNAYRFSIEWARIEPVEGQWDTEEVDHYRQVLLACHERGLVPMVTLNHFTLPIWVSEDGGWDDPGIVDRFERYVAFAAEAFGDQVDMWVTINEPTVVLGAAYGVGLFPPGKSGGATMVRAMKNMARAHVRAYRALHERDRIDVDGDGRAAFVSIAHHMRIFEPLRAYHPGDILAARAFDQLNNWLFLRAIQTGLLKINIPGLPKVNLDISEEGGSLDWLGVNYYSRDFIKFALGASFPGERITNPDAEHTDMGWEIYPEGLNRILMSVKDMGLPVYITENGLADAADAKRWDFTRRHLQEMARAMQAGVDVRGYMHWSLIDNFEWLEGFHPRFGLIAVDYETQERTIRPSALRLKSLIQAGRISLPPRATAARVIR